MVLSHCMEDNESLEKVSFVTRGIITDKVGNVLIVQRPDNTWCLPGGKMNSDEVNPEESLSREIQEETSLIVNGFKLIKTTEIIINGTLWHNGYFIIADWFGEIVMQEDEVIDYKWISPKDLDYYIFSFNHRKIIQEFFASQEL